MKAGWAGWGWALGWMATAVAAAAQSTPEGLWATYNDQHTQVQSLVRIERQGNVLIGVIEKVLDPSAGPEETCDACKGANKGAPLKGLTIMTGVAATAVAGTWKGGKILDPESGDEYRLELELTDQGRVLMVRGYWGLFWRTQRWSRSQPSPAGK